MKNNSMMLLESLKKKEKMFHKNSICQYVSFKVELEKKLSHDNNQKCQKIVLPQSEKRL